MPAAPNKTNLIIKSVPDDLFKRMHRYCFETNSGNGQLVEQAVTAYIQSGCRNLLPRLEIITERKRLAEETREKQAQKKLNRVPGRKPGRPKKFNGIS